MQEHPVLVVVEVISVEDAAGLRAYSKRASELIGPLGGVVLGQGRTSVGKAACRCGRRRACCPALDGVREDRSGALKTIRSETTTTKAEGFVLRTGGLVSYVFPSKRKQQVRRDR